MSSLLKTGLIDEGLDRMSERRCSRSHQDMPAFKIQDYSAIVPVAGISPMSSLPPSVATEKKAKKTEVLARTSVDVEDVQAMPEIMHRKPDEFHGNMVKAFTQLGIEILAAPTV